MGKIQKDLKGANPSEFCEDGSCGCGCGELVEIKTVFSQGKTREVLSSSGEESKKIREEQIKK